MPLIRHFISTNAKHYQIHVHLFWKQSVLLVLLTGHLTLKLLRNVQERKYNFVEMLPWARFSNETYQMSENITNG